jgi:hypothetical protein
MPSQLENLLPDFSDMEVVVHAATEARLKAHQVKGELESYIAACVRSAYQNQQYWINGKPPTQTYIDKVVSVVGNTDEDAVRIRQLSQEYFDLQRVQDESRQLLQNMRDQLAAFQTLSSNKRAGVV